MTAAPAQKFATVHLINPMRNPTGGSEQRLLHLYHLLKRHCQVEIWSEAPPHSKFVKAYPIRKLNHHEGKFPRGGVVVIIGVYFPVGRWLKDAQPARTIMLFNTFSPDQFHALYHQLANDTGRPAEITYASNMLKEHMGIEGIIEDSIIDIRRFAPSPPIKSSEHEFIIGRLSRDVLEKHHPQDLDLYRRLIGEGCDIRIMGGTCLKERMADNARIELLPAGSIAPWTFLQSLDCFFYRTSANWKEASGRVVTEAMACGLPVVCHSSGGYIEYIDHGRTGFVFDSDEQAMQLLLMLKNEPELRNSIGRAARQDMEAMFSNSAIEKSIHHYLTPA